MLLWAEEVQMRVDIGAGSVTVLASPFGIPAQAMQQKPHPACEAPSCTNYCQGCPDPAQTVSLNDTIISEVNAHLFNPFPLLAHAEAVIGDAMAAEKIFDAGEGLSVAVNRRAAGAWTVSVTNPSVTQLDLKLVSREKDGGAHPKPSPNPTPTLKPKPNPNPITL